MVGLVVLVLFAGVAVGAKSPPEIRVEALELSTVTREVDLTSPLVKQKVTMVVENKGSKAVAALLYTVEPQLAQKVAYITAQVRGALLNSQWRLSQGAGHVNGSCKEGVW